MSFIPPRSAISNITQTYPGVVTTQTAHELVTGAIVRLTVPKNYGMDQLNNQLFSVTVIDSTTFSLQYTQTPFYDNVDTRNFSAFTVPANPRMTAQVLSVGSGPTPIDSPELYAQNNVFYSKLEDSTRNVSTNN